MPVYNKEKYIKKTIESILKQSFNDFELIIVNDGSIDKSLTIIQAFNDSRIKVISIKNSGVSFARNIGIENSNGQYITFIDADDYIDENFLINLYNENSLFVIGNIIKVDENGTILKNIHSKWKGNVPIYQALEDFYLEQEEKGIYGYVASKLIKRSLVIENNIRFNEKLKLAEDLDFYLKIYDIVDSIFFTHDTDYYYVQNTNNSAICQDDDKIDFLSQIYIQKNIKNLLTKKNFYKKNNKKMYLIKVSNYVYTLLISNNFSSYNRFKNWRYNMKDIVTDDIIFSVNFKGVVLCLFKYNLLVPCFIMLRLRYKIKELIQ